MSMNVALFMILSGMCLIPTLVAGAISDIKTRTFPAKTWDTLCVKAGGIVTIICYLYMIGVGLLFWVGVFIGISIISSLVFYTMGLRFGSGGDWRALIYIALVCPLFVIQTVIVALVAAVPLAMWSMGQDDILVPTPYRTVPFAVAILVGFIIAAMGSAWVMGI